jgi:hypothetical protein
LWEPKPSITGRPAPGAGYNKDVGNNGEEENLRLPEPLHTKVEMSLKTWIKRLGFWGFMFFLLKGLLWLTIPALIAVFATDH